MRRTVKQLTIRGFDAQLAERIHEVSKAEGISLNQAAQQLLRRGAGLERTGNPRAIGSGLDDLIGTWSLEEARELDQAVQDFETVDEEMWR